MTPAVDQLRAAGVAFETLQYDHDPDVESYGDEAAVQLGLDPDEVFKTLIAEVDESVLVAAIVPTSTRLDLKRLARAAGGKRARMADPQVAQRSSGYVLGGISPFGQRKHLPTYLDETAEAFAVINVSGGRRGLEVRLAPADLRAVLHAVVAPIASF